jgi:hypothetical protein
MSGKTSAGSPAEVMDEPTQPAEPTVETKRSRGLGRYAVWAFVAVMVYVLSSGPVMNAVLSIRSVWRVVVIYRPLGWAYWHTPLRKPLGMYWHLWLPGLYDRNGEHNMDDDILLKPRQPVR